MTTEILLTYIPRDESDTRGHKHRIIQVDGRVEIKHDHVWVNTPMGMEVLAWFDGDRAWKVIDDAGPLGGGGTELFTDITIVSMS